MENLEIKRTNQTPGVNLNASSGLLSFYGRSLPEDSTKFYKKIFNWINEYIKNPPRKTEVTFELDYFNTASAKAIFSIIIRFDELYQSSHDISINWHFDDDDDDMKELGEEYQDLFKIPIKLIANSNE